MKTNMVEIWDPKTGTPYVMNCRETNNIFLCFKVGTTKMVAERSKDAQLPLFRVGCLFDSENVYINTQPFDSPDQMDWNIENKKSWHHYITPQMIQNYFTSDLQVQSVKLDYFDIDPLLVNKIKINVEKYVKEK